MLLLFGGKMETKFSLNLCANYSNENLKSAVSNCLLAEFVIEKLRETIKKFNKEDIDLFYVYEGFKGLIEKGNDVSFDRLADWEANKVSVYEGVLNLVVSLDEILAEASLIESGTILEEFRESALGYMTLLNMCDITTDYIDLSFVEVRQDFLDNLKRQLALVDEGQFLSDFKDMNTEVVPIEINKVRHKYIEQKLAKAEKVANDVSRTLESEFENLHTDIMNSYDRFYKIAYSPLSDGEKSNASRDVCKMTSPHKKLLDKLENKLTTANELKRQLFINEKKLKENHQNKLAEFDAKLESVDDAHKLAVARQRAGYLFVYNEYLEKIEDTIELVNKVGNDISERYNMLDRIDASLRSAIPGESEMKRYSGLVFKFEDLYVRLDLAKHQIKNQDKDFTTALKAAMAGLRVLSHYAGEGKELFIRNSLLSMVFNSVNSIYDLVDTKNKSLELTQVKFVTSRLVKYSLLNSNFVTDLRTFRHVCNNTIRDVAIMMGREFNLQTMVQIVETIELATHQIEELLKTLNENHVEQSHLLGDILNVN